MPLTDVTDGSRVVKEASCPVQIVLAAAAKVGDLLTAAGALADGNAATPAPAALVAGTAGASGATITAYKRAVVGGVSGGALGTKVFLSDTAGGYTETASTTQRQVVGQMVSATEMLIEPERMPDRFTVCVNAAAADIVSTTSARRVYLATQRVRVTKITESHAVVAGQAGTATVERLQGTEAVGGGNGDDLLGTTKVDLAGTINTAQTPALTGTAANLVLEIGDRLALKLATGAATSLVGSIWAIELEPA